MRAVCQHGARCMTGCPFNAKNTTVKNYLHLAEVLGAKVHAMTTVTAVRPVADGYAVDTVRSGAVLRKRERTFTAKQVVFAAAARGTQDLLHKMKDEGVLTELSPRLGALTRPNSEARDRKRGR